MTRHLSFTLPLFMLAVVLLSACELFSVSTGRLGQPCDDRGKCKDGLTCSAQSHRCEALPTDSDGDQETERESDLSDPDTDTQERDTSEGRELEEDTADQETETEEAAEVDTNDGDCEVERESDTADYDDADADRESEAEKEQGEADGATDGDLTEIDSEDSDPSILTPGFVRITAGTFMMGSPESELGRNSNETLHQVTLTYNFEMSKYETSQGEFTTFAGTNPSWFGPNADGPDCGTNCPVERVTWFEALAYANWLSEQKGLTPCYVLSSCVGTIGGGCAANTSLCEGTYSCSVSLNGVDKPQDCQGFRLPSEAEWEYAIRAGTISAFYNGEISATGNVKDPKMELIGWYYYNSDTGSGMMTHPGGQKAANAWGLYDMAGNVWEWVGDWYQDAYQNDEKTNPFGPPSGSYRVRRGGDFHNTVESGRSAFRSPAPPSSCHLSIGFRLVRTLPSTSTDGDLDNDSDIPACADGPCCQGGVKVEAGQACLSGQDSLACTDDLCDALGTCTHPRKAAACLIENTCYINHDANPTNRCRWCDAASNAWADKPASEACNDALDCTYNDHCDGSGACTGTTITCVDESDTCGIKRQCRGTDTCKETFPGNETGCDDANECTEAGVCNGIGACATSPSATGTPCGTGATNQCDQGVCLDCTNDAGCTDLAPTSLECAKPVCNTAQHSCDYDTSARLGESCSADALSCTLDLCAADGNCTHDQIAAGSCLIDGVCYADHESRPGTPCQWCDATAKPKAWSFKPSTESCDDNDPCTLGDICRAGGVCEGDVLPNDCEEARCGSSPSGCYTCSCELGLSCNTGNGVCLSDDAVTISPGEFVMGSPDGRHCAPDALGCTTPPDAEPTRYGDEWQHLVTLTQPYEMMKRETTQNDFYLLMNYRPCQYGNCGSSCPVENLSWHEAQAYANALSVKRKLPACFDCTGTGDAMRCVLKARYAQVQDCPGYRLPTEAEWEYAARAGTRTAFYFGDLNADNRCSPINAGLNANGWFCGNSAISYAGGYPCEGWGSGFTTCGPQPVGQKPASPWGLYDIHGGIWEWTNDLYAPYSILAGIDPSGPTATSADIHAFRGGSWYDYAMYARAAIRRLGYNGDTKRGYIGFRLVRSLPRSCDGPSSCSAHGICDPSSEVGACLCDEGFAGAACDHCADGALGTYPDCLLAPAAYCKSNSCSPVPPSSQALCYDDEQLLATCPSGCNNIPPADFCGQDAQSPDAHRYLLCIDKDGYETNCSAQATLQNDQVVLDTLTKLTWQRTSVAAKTFSEAVTYCQDLTWAGHDDWRLPSLAELSSLVDLGQSAPAIDPLAFPETVTTSGYWTNRELASAPTTRAWLVEFADGKAYNDLMTVPGALRCVRDGAGQTGTNVWSRFTTTTPIAGEPLVKDRVTGLYWQGQALSGLTWKQALSACQALDYAGHSDWRLPNRHELASLIDISIQSPASSFPDPTAQWFWSSSTRVGATSNAWRVDFTSGNVLFGQKTYSYYARCVRGGP